MAKKTTRVRGYPKPPNRSVDAAGEIHQEIRITRDCRDVVNGQWGANSGGLDSSTSHRFSDRKGQQCRGGEGAKTEQSERSAVSDLIRYQGKKSRTDEAPDLAHKPPKAEEPSPRNRKSHIRAEYLHAPGCDTMAALNPEKAGDETGEAPVPSSAGCEKHETESDKDEPRHHRGFAPEAVHQIAAGKCYRNPHDAGSRRQPSQKLRSRAISVCGVKQ